MLTVVKIGGAAIQGGADPAVVDIAALHEKQLLVVHGGGAEITHWSSRLGVETKFVGGRRVTDPDTADVAEMVLTGRVGRALAQAFADRGLPAVSLCGKDAGFFAAEPLDPALGQVGRVGAVNPAVLEALWAGGILPLVAPIAPGPGGLTFNINGDDAAADLAVALGATALILASDVPGVLVDGRALERCTPAETEALIASGVIRGGMVPKVQACLRALAGGVQHATIVDGSMPGAVAGAIAGAGHGTRFVA
ncbi:MAG TPA: acetylglutamate kinase [Bacillota bacterium]|nr:acetylglutamate kinase [Bacillota bacterium]